MQVRERQRLDEPQASGMVLVSLARKAHHHVGPDCGVGNLFVDGQNPFGILFRPIAAVHQAQDSVAPALERNVEMLRHADLTRPPSQSARG